MKQDLIIAKQESRIREVIDALKNRICNTAYSQETICNNLDTFRDEIISYLKQDNSETEVHFIQTRKLTDEEWLRLPKEEILQLYKNCYKMLQNYIGLSGEKVEDIPTITTTDFEIKKPGDQFKGKYPFISEEQAHYSSIKKAEEEALNRFDLWVKKNKAGYHYADVHNTIIDYFKILSIIDLSDEEIEEEEYHEIHDDIIEAKRNGEIE
jgi:hypothetical protein